MASNGNATSTSDHRPGQQEQAQRRHNEGHHTHQQVQGVSLNGQGPPPVATTETSIGVDTRVRRLERTALLVSRAILRCHTEGPVLDDACRLLVEEAGCTMAWIGQQDGNAIVPVAQANVPPNYCPPQGPNATALDPARTALHEDRPRVAQNLGTGSDGLHIHAAEHGYAAQCAVPVRLADGPGVLVVYSSDPKAFQAEEVALLWETAGDLEHGIQRMRELAIREEQEQELARTKAHYDLFYENASVPLFMTSLGGRITSANHAFARMLGKDRAEEVLEDRNVSLYTIMTPMDKNRLFDQAPHEEAPSLELTFFSGDHRSTRASVSARIVTTEEGPRLIVHAQALDLTGSRARKQAPGPSEVKGVAVRHPSVDEFVHQMNNAMTPILNHVELALSAKDPTKDRHLKAAQEATLKLSRRVQDLHAAQPPNAAVHT